jgi:hypothetical protein
MHSIFLPRAISSAHIGGKIVVQAPVSRVSPLPREQWPLWARAIAKFRRDSDVGLGDTVVHLIGDTRSERFKKWFARKFGRSCGCTDRQRWMNQRYPY